MSMQDDQRFLTVDEVATMLRVSKHTVYRLIHSGALVANRIGRSFRVSENSANEYLLDSMTSRGNTQ